MNTTHMPHEQFLRTVAEDSRGELTRDEFEPLMLTYSPHFPHPTAVLHVQITEDYDRSWERIAGAARVLCSAQDDVTALVHVADSYTLIGVDTMATDAEGSLLKADGTPWAQHDMEHAIKHRTADAAHVAEALSISFISTEEDFTLACLPYRRKTVDWEGEAMPMDVEFLFDDMSIMETSEAGTAVTGNIPHAMRSAMLAEKATSQIMRSAAEQDAQIPDHIQQMMHAQLLTTAVASIKEHTGLDVTILRPTASTDEQ